MPQDILVCEDLGCAYRWNYEFSILEFCPPSTNGLLYADEWGAVEEDLIGKEIVTYKGIDTPLSVVYRDVEKQLKIRGNVE